MLVLVVGLVAAAPAFGSARPPTLSEVEHEVMCPTCKTLLALSHAPVAERMRAFIRARIAAGESKNEIESQLVAEFGEGVLAEPPRHGFGLLAWVLPLLGLVGSAAGVAFVTRQWARGHRDEHHPAEPSGARRRRIDAALERELDRELARFDS